MSKKQTAWLLWAAGLLGFGGLHRFYLGKIGTGILWLLTGGLFFVGQLYDAFALLPNVGEVDMENQPNSAHPSNNSKSTTNPFKKRKAKKNFREAQKHLKPEEKVVAGVFGAGEIKLFGEDTVKNSILLATDQRVIFFCKRAFGSYDMEVFPYENISSTSTGKKAMGHTVKIYASGNDVYMKWINDGNPQNFIQQVQSRIGKKSATQNDTKDNNQPDIAEQISKLSDLKEQGVITEEEFTSKKEELLSRM